MESEDIWGLAAPSRTLVAITVRASPPSESDYNDGEELKPSTKLVAATMDCGEIIFGLPFESPNVTSA